MNNARKGKDRPVKGREEVRAEVIATRIPGTEHERAGMELWRHHDKLEAIVKERTAALVGADSQLRRGSAERKQVEEQLLESDQQFRAVFEHSTEGILIADMGSKKFVDGNSTICRMLGYDLEEVKTLGVADIHPKEDLPHVLDNFEKLVRREIDLAEGIRVQRKDGSVFYADISSCAMKLDGKTYVAGMFRDVTERKREKEELAMQARIAAIFVTVPDDEMFNEVLKVIQDVTHSPFRVLGYLDEAGALVVPTMTRQTWDKCQISDKKIRFPRETWGDSSWSRAIREKKANYTNEVSTKLPEGHITITRHISLPILFHGEVIGLFQAANSETDYTEVDIRTLQTIADQVAPLLSARLQRLRVEEKLKKSESKFQAIFDNTSDGIFLVDLKARKLFICNATCTTMLGYTQEEFSNLDIGDIHPGEDLPFIYEQIGKFSRGEEGIRSDIRFKRKDGGIFVADLAPVLLTIAEKEYLVISFRDITERKRAEEAVRISEQRFRALVETTSDFVWEVDQNCFYTYASPKVKDLLGYDPEEVIGKTPFDFMPPDEAKRIAKLFWDIAEFRKPVDRLENTNLHKDGRRIVLETSGVPIIDEKGNLVGYRGIDRDVTERKQAEASLWEKERAIESSINGIAICDLERKITYVNAACLKLWGNPSREEVLGRNAADFWDSPGKIEELVNTLKEHEGWFGELTAKRKDGSTFEVGVSASRVVDKTGKPISLLAEVIDISKRKLTEKKRAEDRRLLRTLIDSLPDFIYVKDKDGRFLLANKALMDFLGVATEQEINGKTDFDFLPVDQATKYYADEQVVLNSGQPIINREELSVDKARGNRWILITKVPLRDESGKIIGLVGMNRDISSRKQAEESYRSIFENSTVGVFQCTPQGEFLAVNRAFARIFGHESAQGVIDMARDFAYQAHYRTDASRAFEQLMEQRGELQDFEFEAFRRDRRKIWVKGSVHVVRDNKGRPAYHEGFLQDITARKEAEEELKQEAQRIIDAQEVERKRIAHSLHDSVSQLLSAAKFRLASAGEKIFDQPQKSCSELNDSSTLIEKAVQEIRRIIHNLRPALLDDLGLLPALRSLCEEFRERTNMELDFRSTPEPTRLAHEVELAVFRIVQEALNNIEKHSRATRVSVSFFQREASLGVKVKDNGVGFDHQAARKRKSNSSEYGLHTMIDRAASIGGETQILSAIEKGTEVIVQIPLNGSGKCD